MIEGLCEGFSNCEEDGIGRFLANVVEVGASNTMKQKLTRRFHIVEHGHCGNLN